MKLIDFYILYLYAKLMQYIAKVFDNQTIFYTSINSVFPYEVCIYNKCKQNSPIMPAWFQLSTNGEPTELNKI